MSAQGKAPKYCYARPDSPYWWYRFKIPGYAKTFAGSTGCEKATAAAAVVEQLRVEAREYVADQQAGVAVIRHGRKQITLEAALNRFEDDHATQWKTLKDKQRYADYLLNLGAGGKMEVSEISEADIIAYRKRRAQQLTPRGTEVSGSTLNREIAHLQSCLNYVGKVLKFDIPLINWKACFDRNAEREQQWVLSKAEEARLFAALQKERADLVPLVQFTIWAAARKAAVVNLRWDHVDLEEGVARIYLKSKGRPKEHLIALTQRMIDLLAALPRVDGIPEVFTYECVATTRDRRGQVKHKGKRYAFTEAGWTKCWLRAVKAAGLEGFRFHDLRHTGATRLTRSSGDIQLTKEQLGHADMKTTLRYSKVDVSDLRRAQERAQVSRSVRAVND